jgi:NAD(P)H-nitrite reductase large subunit
MKYLIIGNSAAGIGALEAIREYDQHSPVTVISNEKYSQYSRCLLSYFLAGAIDEKRLHFRPSDFHRKMNSEILLGRKVVSVDTSKYHVVCDNGSKLDYDRLLIATGSSPKIPENIPGETDGIYTLRTIADAYAIKNKIRSGRNAVVLGGGLVGLKTALALNKHIMSVSVVMRSRHVLSQMIDFSAAQIVMNKLAEEGIDILIGADITSIATNNGKLISVNIEGAEPDSKKNVKREQECDLLVVAKGVKTNTELIDDTSIERNRGIITDENMRSSEDNIFAAGDVAETYDVATEQPAVNALWTCAVQQGKIAGYNMAGQNRKYNGSVGMNSLNFSGVDLISFGIVRPGEDEEYETLTEGDINTGYYKKLVLKENIIKGLVLVNKIDNAGVLLSLLGRKVNIKSIKDKLLSDRFSYAQVLGKGGRTELQRYMKAAHLYGSCQDEQ